MNGKLKLIREIESEYQIKRFNVNSKSSEDELDTVLQFLDTQITQLWETEKPKIEQFID